MSNRLWDLRIHFSNLLDRYKWYRKLLGGDWYLVRFRMQTHLSTFWVRRYADDDLDFLCDCRTLNPYIDILDIENYE